MQYSVKTALFVSSLLAVASAAPSGFEHPQFHRPSYYPHDYYRQNTYYPNSNAYQNYYPYAASKPNFYNAYDKQQEYDTAIAASDNENGNANENLAGAKSENANENANLAKGGEAFGFGALESDNRNLLANENNIEVANANKNELGVEVANFNANDNTAQQESAALAEVQSEDMAFFEDFIANEADNMNANENLNDNYDTNGFYNRGGRNGGYQNYGY